MVQYKSFETERLILKPTVDDDADFILELMNSPKWIVYIGDRNVKTREEARSYIRTKMLPQLQRLGYANYTVIRKSDQVKMGSCGLYDREGLEGIDIGFAFLPGYEKQGYATEAARRVIEYAFNDLQLKGLFAGHNPKNTASRHLLEKLGFQYTHDEYYEPTGLQHPSYLLEKGAGDTL